ncbi:FxsA protein [Actinosynnema pretiosum]|uniref:FxsA protein n=2 Tax=Actinosynnema pretiosum TaxID=42197 RepID=A0A290Z7T0_9PSEU|nr:FxsA protein [Actinosynnema pretiosum]
MFVRCGGMRVFALLLVAVGVEIATLVAVTVNLGFLPTLGLLILGGVAGSFLLRREGARSMAAFNEALRNRREPHEEVADGVLLVAAGLLIVLPGFLSDVAGLLLLLPPVRRAVGARIARRSRERAANAVLNQRFGRPPGAGNVVVDGVIIDLGGQAGAPRPRSGSGPLGGNAIEGVVIDSRVVDGPSGDSGPSTR